MTGSTVRTSRRTLARTIRSCPVPDLVAAYDHAEAGELPRLVFHPSRDDADSTVPPESHSSSEMVYRGGANDVNLMLWAPEGGGPERYHAAGGR